MSPRLINRFENLFTNTDDTVLVTIKGVNFVLINSMQMEGDGCHLCKATERKIENISLTLQKKDVNGGEHSRPILLQVKMF